MGLLPDPQLYQKAQDDFRDKPIVDLIAKVPRYWEWSPKAGDNVYEGCFAPTLFTVHYFRDRKLLRLYYDGIYRHFIPLEPEHIRAIEDHIQVSTGSMHIDYIPGYRDYLHAMRVYLYYRLERAVENPVYLFRCPEDQPLLNWDSYKPEFGKTV